MVVSGVLDGTFLGLEVSLVGHSSWEDEVGHDQEDHSRFAGHCDRARDRTSDDSCHGCDCLGHWNWLNLKEK